MNEMDRDEVPKTGEGWVGVEETENKILFKT